MRKFLKLHLSSSMQSYGKSCYTEVRTTHDAPTRSAVLGMIEAAMHIRFFEEEKKQKLSDQLMIAVENNEQIIRRMRDFQVVKSCKDPKGFLTASGDHKERMPLVYKDYLMEAEFVVRVIGEEDVIKDVAIALRHPAYPIYLGRKCCIPNRPIFDGTIEDYDENEMEETCINLS